MAWGHFSQQIQQEDDIIILETIIYSQEDKISSRVWINHPSIFKPEGRRAPIQELGSNITYMKRYSIVAMLGLVIAEDDVDQGPVRIMPDRVITDKQVALLQLKLIAKPHIEQQIVNKLGIADIHEIPIAKFNDILKWIDNQ